MTSVATVERQIGNFEEFDVMITHPDGQDARSDLGSGSSSKGLPSYNFFERKAPSTMTVNRWKQKRFRQHYAGYDVEVLDASGRKVPGNTLLKTVRESYEEEE